MEVNVAINIKVDTIFRAANEFHEGGAGNSPRGRKDFLGGEEIFPPPSGDSVVGETIFCDTGKHI